MKKLIVVTQILDGEINNQAVCKSKEQAEAYYHAWTLAVEDYSWGGRPAKMVIKEMDAA